MPAYPEVRSSLLPPKELSVFDSYTDRVLRGLAGLVGADDPAGTAMGLAGPLALPAMAAQKVAQPAAKVASSYRDRIIRAFHGSPHDFEKFDIAKAGTTTDAGEMGRGLYFATDPKVAASRPHKYEVDLRVKNPLQVSMPDWRTNKRSVVADALRLPRESGADDIAKAAKARGHDSVELDYSPAGWNHKEIAVFDDAMVSIVKKYVAAGFAFNEALKMAQADTAYIEKK